MDNMRSGYGYPLVRVYKCAFISSIQSEFVPGWPSREPQYDTINARPITAELIEKFFDEYWLQGANSGSVMLERSVEDVDGFVQYRTHEALVVYGDWGLCDRILLMGSIYLVQKDTGEVSAFRTVLPESEGRCH
jgi:hypothetical protein